MITITPEVLADIKEGFKVPSPPELLIAVQDICKAEDTNLMELEKLVSGDIGLSSAILKTINSPLYGMNRVISDINQENLIACQ